MFPFGHHNRMHPHLTTITTTTHTMSLKMDTEMHAEILGELTQDRVVAKFRKPILYFVHEVGVSVANLEEVRILRT